MKSIYNNIVKGGLLGAAMLLGVSSCSDDHFDVKTDVNGVGLMTIWQNIEQDTLLSDFAQILKSTRVMTKETDTKSVQTYADFFNQPQSVTLWAPKNGTFDKDYYLAILDSAAKVRLEDPLEAAKIEYDVVYRFINNHVARFNYEYSNSLQKVRLMNAKNCDFNPSANLFNGVQITPQGKFIGSNGVMHTLEAVSPFADNIFDYMGSNENVSTVFNVISSAEVTTFMPSWSTEGAMNENAEMVYVDSAFYTSNSMLDNSGALIKSEDSLYVALIPTNLAWDGAVEKVSPLYQYGASYSYDWSSTENTFLKKASTAYKISAAEQDSLRELSTQNTILSSMYFNVTDFKLAEKDSVSIIDYLLTADSLISTNGHVFYNKTPGSVNPMFLTENGETIKPVKASNGYIFPVDVYNIDPSYSFIKRINELKMTQGNLGSVRCGRTDYWGQTMILTEETRIADSIVAGISDLEDDTYYYFESSSTSQGITIKVPLRNIASGNYKISMIMLPNKVYLPRSVDAEGKPKVEEPKFDVALYGDDEKRIAKGDDTFVVSQDKVEKIVLFENIEIEKSYSQLPSGISSFPYIEITTKSRDQSRGNFNALSIKSIVIEPIRK